MQITLIGSGNVATHLGAALKNAGHKILQVYSRNYQNAALLAYYLSAEPVNSLQNINGDTELFIIAVNDDAIGAISKQLAVYKKTIVHTSGTTSINDIVTDNSLAGVFYPLQTFNKNKELNFNTVPLGIEGSNPQVTQTLTLLANSISKTVFYATTEQRRALHLSAVFACNFANNLFATAQALLQNHHLDFDLLKPLILETAEKAQYSNPLAVQTGPAIRRDEKTMAIHLELLKDKPDLQTIYHLMSQNIIKMAVSTEPDE
jgi:predicted short-subunit dehydrogenase-like oxidoreductase (DUF2520 family)